MPILTTLLQQIAGLVDAVDSFFDWNPLFF